MSKVTTSSHPLAALRACCGFTRDALARIAGLTAATIQNLELNRAKLSENAAIRIEAATGCLASSLMDSQSRPVSLNGTPYTAKTYESYRRASKAATDDTAADEAAFRVRTLLAASGDHFLYVCRRLDHALNEIATEAGIPPQAISEVERRAATLQTLPSMTVEEIKQEIGPAPILLQWLKAHPQPPESKVKITVEKFRHWLRDSQFQRAIAYSQRVERKIYRIEFADDQMLSVAVDEGQGRAVGVPPPSASGVLKTE